MAVRGITGSIACGDALRNDQHPSVLADVIIANPPLTRNDWGHAWRPDDVRWRFGVPPPDNLDFAWLQHLVHHLAPGGRAGIALARRSLACNRNGEGAIRRALVEADLVDCIITLPGRLPSAPAVPLCLWLLARDKDGAGSRKRSGDDALHRCRRLQDVSGVLHRSLDDAEIERLVALYHAWRGGPRFRVCRSPRPVPRCRPGGGSPAAVRADPARYISGEAIDDDEHLADKMPRLQAKLDIQLAEAERLPQVIAENMRIAGR